MQPCSPLPRRSKWMKLCVHVANLFYTHETYQKIIRSHQIPLDLSKYYRLDTGYTTLTYTYILQFS